MKTYFGKTLVKSAAAACLALFFVGINVAAAQTQPVTGASDQPSQVYVQDVSLGQSSYNPGNTVQGTFDLTNEATVDASNMYYRILFVGDYDSNGVPHALYQENSLVGPTYIPAKGSVPEAFSYTLPQSSAGDSTGIEIQALTQAGRLISWADKQFTLSTSTVGLINVSGVTIQIGKNSFFPTTGPTVPAGQSAQMILNISNPLPTTVTVSPQFAFYNRIVTGSSMLSTTSAAVTLAPGQQTTITYTLPLFNNVPGVYAGTVNFVDANGVVRSPQFEFRYILPGNIATIQSVTLNQTAVSAGQPVTTTVFYTGAPYDILTGQNSDQGQGELVATLYDQSGTQIAQGTSTASLNGVTEAQINMTTTGAGQNVYANVVLSKDGQTLSTFTTNKNPNYQKPGTGSLTGLWYGLIGLALLTILVAFWWRAKKSGVTSSMMPLFLLILTTLLIVPSFSRLAADTLHGAITGVDSSGNVTGWLVDSTNISQPTFVSLFVQGVKNAINLAWWPSDLYVSNVGVDHRTGDYGFSFPLPINFFDNKQHTLTVYGIEGSANAANSSVQIAQTSFKLLSSALSSCAQGTVGACAGGWTYTGFTSSTQNISGNPANSDAFLDPDDVTLNLESGNSSGTTVQAGQPITVSMVVQAIECTNSTADISGSLTFVNGQTQTFDQTNNGGAGDAACSGANSVRPDCVSSVSNQISAGSFTAPSTPGVYKMGINVTWKGYYTWSPQSTITGYIYVNVVAPVSASLSADPGTIASGNSSTLTWTSTNVDSCVATSPAGWTSKTDTADSQSVSPTQTTTYEITCTRDSDGATATASATVTVTTVPTANLSANPASITSGQPSTLTWSSTNVDSCAAIDATVPAGPWSPPSSEIFPASSDWTSQTSTSGSQSVSPTANTKYEMTCTRASDGANVTVSATVMVAPACSQSEMWDNTTSSCVTTCTSGDSCTCPLPNETVDSSTGQCVLTCSGGQLEDTTSNTCVSNCPSGDTCACPTGETLDATSGECVPTCPSGQMGDITTGECITPPCPAGDVCNSPSCSSGETWDSITDACVNSSCPSGQTWDPNTFTCISTTCPSGDNWFDSSTDSCVSSCPSGDTCVPTNGNGANGGNNYFPF